MKLKITGLIFILVGFAAPFILKKIFPTFLYASFISTLCFWIGFISLLSPIDDRIELNPYLRWARYAIFFNIAWTILFAGYLNLMNYFASLRGIGYSTLEFFEFLSNPVGSIFDLIVPKPMEQLSDGSVRITFSFVRMLLTTFFSLVVFSVAGAILKLIKDKKITRQFT